MEYSRGFGSVGMLMDVLPYLEKVNSDAIALQGAQGSTDRRLATALFEQFLTALIEGIEADVSRTKVASSRIRLSLQDLDDMKARILQASRTESARFADIDSEGIEKLVAGLIEESVESLPGGASVDEIAAKLNILTKHISSVEDALARLDDAFSEMKKLVLALEQSQWKQSPSRV
jgi:hypothetical protein